MKLAFKLIFALVLGVVALLVVEAYSSVAREDEQFEQDMARELDVVGRALAVLLQDAWERQGRDHALALLERVDREQADMAIRWVSLLDDTSDDARPVAAHPQLAAARRGERMTVMVVNADGARSLVAYEPIDVGSAWIGAIELSQPMTLAEQHERDTLLRVALLTVLVAIIGGVLIAILGVVWVGRPLDRLIDKARRVAAGDLETKVDLHTNDELEALGDELDVMSDTLARARGAVREEAEARVRAEQQP